MTNRTLGLVPAFALLAVSPVGRTARLDAQEPVRLAFGYQCDNRFVLRNEGATGVEVAYEVVGTPESGRVSIEAGQTISLEPREPGDVAILVDDRVVATEPNSRVACQPNVVVVRPPYQGGVVTVVEPYYYRRPVYTIAPPRLRFVLPRVIRIESFFRGFSRGPDWGSRGRRGPQTGSRDGRPQDGNGAGRPQAGDRDDRPQAGNRNDRPQAGNRNDRPQTGDRAERPQNGAGSGRPRGGSDAGRPQKGSGSGRPASEPRSAHPRRR